MDPAPVFESIFSSHALRTVALGAAALGAVSGALGSFAVLRRQSLLGDAISHAALPGIAIAFLLTGSKATLVLMIGAAIAGWLGTITVMAVVGLTRVKEDAALGVVLSVFFGTGLVLLTFIQRLPNANQAGLDRFLFGQAAALLRRDVATILVVGAGVLAALILLWKEFKLLSFDREFGASLGMPVRALDFALTALLVVAIVLGLQTVGVVLMSAMVVAPAAAARQWTNRLGIMVALSGFFGAAAGVVGAVISSTAEKMPTGPAIVLCVSAIVVASLLFAPARGIVWTWSRHRLARSRLGSETALVNLYELAEQHGGERHGHTAGALNAMSPGTTGIMRSIRELEARRFVREIRPGEWVLTDEGADEAQRLARPEGRDNR
jgi:manganese/zinc/iron transport system permease protein